MNFASRDIGYQYATGSRFISPTELDTFCTISGMREEPFLRDECAQALGFKARVVPGAFILGVLFGLLLDEGHLKDGVYTGSQNMRFLAPAHPFDKIRAEGEVLGKREVSKGERVLVSYSWTIKNQDDVTIAQGENT